MVEERILMSRLDQRSSPKQRRHDRRLHATQIIMALLALKGERGAKIFIIQGGIHRLKLEGDTAHLLRVVANALSAQAYMTLVHRWFLELHNIREGAPTQVLSKSQRARFSVLQWSPYVSGRHAELLNQELQRQTDAFLVQLSRSYLPVYCPQSLDRPDSNGFVH